MLGATTGNHDDSEARVQGPEFLDDFKAVLPRHEHIQQDEVDRVCRHALEPLQLAGPFQHRITGLLRRSAQAIAEAGIVVNNKYRRHHSPARHPNPRIGA